MLQTESAVRVAFHGGDAELLTGPTSIFLHRSQADRIIRDSLENPCWCGRIRIVLIVWIPGAIEQAFLGGLSTLSISDLHSNFWLAVAEIYVVYGTPSTSMELPVCSREVGKCGSHLRASCGLTRH